MVVANSWVSHILFSHLFSAENNSGYHEYFCMFSELWQYVICVIVVLNTIAYTNHGPLARYVKIRVAHAPGMPGTFSPAANFRGNYFIAIPACITARAWRTCRDACRDRLPAVTGKTFPAFPAHAQPQFCVSGKRPIAKAISEAIFRLHLAGPPAGCDFRYSRCIVATVSSAIKFAYLSISFDVKDWHNITRIQRDWLRWNLILNGNISPHENALKYIVWRFLFHLYT